MECTRAFIGTETENSRTFLHWFCDYKIIKKLGFEYLILWMILVPLQVYLSKGHMHNCRCPEGKGLLVSHFGGVSFLILPISLYCDNISSAGPMWISGL
jgi:hypothetical protein